MQVSADSDHSSDSPVVDSGTARILHVFTRSPLVHRRRMLDVDVCMSAEPTSHVNDRKVQDNVKGGDKIEATQEMRDAQVTLDRCNGWSTLSPFQ